MSLNRVIISIFLVMIFSWSGQTKPSLIENIISLKKDNSQKNYQNLETIFQTSTNLNETTRVALLLSTVAPAKIKQHPAVYAEYYLKNKKNIDENTEKNLLRVAADGFYDMGKFKTAEKWYLKIINQPSINNKSKEYSVYKLAWAKINQSQQKQAFHILEAWLSKNSTYPLREPMIFDLGRSYGEFHFRKKVKPSLVPPAWLTKKLEQEKFIAGFIRAAKREKVSLVTLYETYHFLPFAVQNMDYFLSHSVFKKISPCFVTKVYKKSHKLLWESGLARRWVKTCSINLTAHPVPSVSPYKSLAHALANEKLSAEEHWLMSKLFKSSKNISSACTSMKLASSEKKMISANTSWWKSWLLDSAEVCTTQAGNDIPYVNFLLENAKFWSANNLASIIIANSQLFDASKDQLFFLWQEKYKIPQHLFEDYQRHLSQLNQEKRKYSLQSFCPLKSAGCETLWYSYVKTKNWPTVSLKQYVHNVFSGKIESQYDLAIQTSIKNKFWKLLVQHANLSWPVIDSNKRYKEAFLVGILSDENKSQNRSWVQKMPSTEIKDYLLLYLDLNVDHSTEKIASIPSPLDQTQFSQDMMKINYFKKRKTQITKTKIDQKNISEIILKVKSLSDHKRKYRWNYSKAKFVSEQHFNQTVDLILAAINNFEKNKKQKMQWQPIAKELKKWKSL